MIRPVTLALALALVGCQSADVQRSRWADITLSVTSHPGQRPGAGCNNT